MGLTQRLVCAEYANRSLQGAFLDQKLCCALQRPTIALHRLKLTAEGNQLGNTFSRSSQVAERECCRDEVG